MFDLKKIKCLLNLDLVATGEEGITIVNAQNYPADFEKINKINAEKKYFAEVKKRNNVSNSDHFYFAKNDVKAFFIYMMGPRKAYHDVEDVPNTISLYGYENLIKLIGDYLE